MFSTGFSMNPQILAEKMDGQTFQWMKKVSAERKVILTGSLIIEENGNYYNRLIWMLPNGQSGMYDKRHLFAYANEHSHYSSGNKRFIASVKGWKINLTVCYDLRFPIWLRQSNKGNNQTDEAEYDVLLNVANWPERRNHAWKTLLQARAIENQSFVIGVNRVGKDGNEINHSGDSMIVNPMGEILYHKVYDEDVFTMTLQKKEVEEVRSKFPFLMDADPFMILQ
jgi:predicted amidohydrolase